MRCVLFAVTLLFSLRVLAQGPADVEPVGDLLSTDASVKGSVVLAAGGTSLLPGSAIEAGSSAANIKLRRGGALRVCPKTQVTVNVTPSAEARTSGSTSGSGYGLMLSLDGGALEANYPLAAQPDTIVTPDFRILLAGPAEFHIAVSVDGRGNTCVSTLNGNSGAVMVSELMGAGTYQVKPNESVLFPNGAIQNAAPAAEACGCPSEEPGRAVEVAQAPPVKTESAPEATSGAEFPQPAAAAKPEPAAPSQTHVEVDAPFVFQAVGPAPEMAAVVSLRSQSVPELPEPQVLPPPAKKQKSKAAVAPELATSNKPHRGFFARIGGFFASIFGGGHKTVGQ